MKRFFQILLVVLLFSCEGNQETAQTIVDSAIQNHGCGVLNESIVAFDFRKHSYTLNKTISDYVYTRSRTDSTGTTVDSLVNSSELRRYLNGEKAELTEKKRAAYTGSVNSVLYFFQVPCVLNDPAVVKTLAGRTQIENEPYYQIKVRFKAEGGGEDYQDTYMYWIHEETRLVDYLAYNYQVSGGGTRFRKAINRRTLNGLVVQDYINYKPEEKFPPLAALPGMYEQGQLKELSRIINRNVEVR